MGFTHTWGYLRGRNFHGFLILQSLVYLSSNILLIVSRFYGADCVLESMVCMRAVPPSNLITIQLCIAQTVCHRSIANMTRDVNNFEPRVEGSLPWPATVEESAVINELSDCSSPEIKTAQTMSDRIQTVTVSTRELSCDRRAALRFPVIKRPDR